MKSLSVWARLACSALFLLTTQGAFALDTVQATSHPAASQPVEFEVYLPLTNVAQLDQLLEAQQTEGSADYHKWLTPQQFKDRFGPSQADVARVTNWLQQRDLTVTAVNSHGLHVQGPVSQVETAFLTSIWNGVSQRGARKLIATTPLVLPQTLQDAGAQVLAFSPTIHQHVHSKSLGQVDQSLLSPDNRYRPNGPYWFTDIRQAYDFPSYQVVTGKGVSVGIVISSDYSDADMALYFGHEKVAPPTIVRRPVLGGHPFDPNSGDSFEASLDIQQVGGMAPGSTVVVYNIPDLSDASILAGYTSVVEDNQADIVNSSFGGFEAAYSAEYNGGQDFSGILTVYNELFKQGNAQGISFVASSGDSGALGKPPLDYFTTAPTKPPSITGYFLPGVEFPASAPNVTAVGGTNLITTSNPPSLQSSYVRENAYGDPELPYDPFGLGNLVAGGYWGSGGGVSEFFKKPAYQRLVRTSSANRTIPDVSLHMGGCPSGISIMPCGPDRSAVLTVVGGKLVGLIGTSVSSPAFAGLLALREEYVPGRLGNANNYIYKLAHEQFSGVSTNQYFHTKIPGFNGYYLTPEPGRHYNYVLGNGTVFGKNFIGAADQPSAGDPQTPTNP